MTGFSIVEENGHQLNPITLQDKPAVKMLYTYYNTSSVGSKLMKGMFVVTSYGKNVYFLEFESEESMFDRQYQTVLNVLNSIDFSDSIEFPPITKTNFINFENNTLGLKMQYPSDWVIEGGGPNFVAFSPVPPTQNYTTPLFGISVIPQPINATLEDITNSYHFQEKQEFANYHLIWNTTSQVDNKPAYTWVIFFGPTAMMMQVYTLNNNLLYRIIYSAGTADYSYYLPAVRSMINSLKLTAPQMN